MRRAITLALFGAALFITSAEVRADSITTIPSPANVTLGASTVTLTDSAILFGATSPTGTITFTLSVPPVNTVVDVETVTVSGDGTYSTPVGYTLPTSATVVGTYNWHAIYNGDVNNPIATSAPEMVNVNSASPKISTVAGGTVVVGSGSVLTDTATLSGGYFETGVITFTLEDPSDITVDTESVVVSGNGTYTTPIGYLPGSFSPTGTYQWDAVYDSSNGNNNSASDIGDPSETETVVPASPSPVPEPSSLVLMSTGFCTALGVLRRRLLVR